MNALVSILMPVKHIDRYVKVAIDSMLAQLDVDIELLLIGAPETSNTNNTLALLLNRYFKRDSRITLVARDKPGIVSALNTGLAHASGSYIARMDADDIAAPERLRTQLKVAQTQPDNSLISACVEIFSDDYPVQAGNRHYQRWLNQLCTPSAISQACFIESPMPHPAWLAHKTVWSSIGNYSNGDFPEDYDFVLRAWLAGIPMIKPERTLLRWREHPQRATRTDPRYRREAFIGRKASALASPDAGLFLDEGRAVWIVGTGRNARYWHDALEAQQVSVAGFVDFDGPDTQRQKRDKPVIGYSDLAELRKDALIVTAISNPDARQQLCTWFADQRMVQGQDVIIGG